MSFGPTLPHCDHLIHATVYVGEVIQGKGWTHTCIRDLGDGAVTQYWKLSVDEGVCHIH